MEVLRARIASFSKTKRVKGSSGKNLTLKWPHPASYSANADTLAEAGFYYDPTPENRDNVSCFMCEKALKDWEEDDDPFATHLDKARGTCPWALLRCSYLGEDEE